MKVFFEKDNQINNIHFFKTLFNVFDKKNGIYINKFNC